MASSSACPAKIAVYRDEGVNSGTAKAIEKAMRWMSYRVRFVDARLIDSCRLEGFGLLCFPDGDVHSLAAGIAGVFGNPRAGK